MAVGCIKTCNVCGQSYDEGAEYHPEHCDGGERKRKEALRLKRLKSQGIEATIEEFDERIRKLEESIGHMPFDGQIG